MMKKPKPLMVIGAVALMAALITAFTNPGKQKHMAAILEKNGLMEEEEGKEPSGFEALGQMMGFAMLDRMLEVRSFLFFSTGRVMYEGESRMVTIGALGNVFFFGNKQEEDPDEEEREEEHTSPFHQSTAAAQAAADALDNTTHSWDEASAPAGFAGCSSVQLSDVLGHWVGDASECDFDGGLWISMDDGSVTMSGWEWSGSVVNSLRESNRTIVQLKVDEDGGPRLMQVEIGMRNEGLVLDPGFRNYCCGDGEGDLVRCP